MLRRRPAFLHLRSLLLAMLALLAAACGEGASRAPEVGNAPGAYDAQGRLTAARPALRARPNIVLLVIDTLRADAVCPEAEGGGCMPYLSGLARGATCFTQASANAPWTLPSLMSMFTGLLPSEHGVISEELQPASLERFTTWAEVLRNAFGYRTVAHTGGFGQELAVRLCQGFDTVQDGFALARPEAALDALADARAAGAPCFLFLHTFEAHDPYGAANRAPGAADEAAQARALAELDALGADAPLRELVRLSVTSAAHRAVLRRHPRYRTRQPDMTRYLWSGLETDEDPAAARRVAADLAKAYQEGLAWVDGLVERTVRGLEARGLLQDTLLIVTGDHGEAFGEHGMLLHGRSLHDEVLRVPLVLKGPAPFDVARVVEGSVGLSDLFPSVLAWLGAPLPRGQEQRSFLPLLDARGPGLPVEAQEVRTHMHTGGLSQAVLGSVRHASWKYIATYDVLAGTLREEAYDLRSDPEERRSRSSPDGFVRDVPFDEAFCHAVERTRDRIWASVAQGSFNAAQGYGSGAQVLQVERPASGCAPHDR